MSFSFLLIPLLVAVVTQILKLSVDSIRGNLTFKNLFISYGGMPSAHTAFCVSVTTLIAMDVGIRTPLFAVSTVFTIIVMRDAVTFRKILGEQGKLLNHIISKMPTKEKKSMPHFMERVGHSVSEVVAGIAWGIFSTLIFYFILRLS